MTTSMQEAAAGALLLVALVAAGFAWRFGRTARAQRRRADQMARQHQAAVSEEQQRVRQLAEQLRSLEDALAYLAETGLAEVAAAVLEPGEGRDVELVLPPPLSGTTSAGRIEALVGRHTRLLREVREESTASAAQGSEQAVAEAHMEARDATRAAVLTFASALVSLGAELAEEVSVGVRRHQDDEAYATLMAIDHTAQQMLRVAQGYMVLAGGTLGRRLPATSLTDVARAAMGRIQGYERVRTQEFEQGVVPRAVEALVHTLAILLDNAVRYSPPTAYAEVSFRAGHNGVTVVIDDAGLQMSTEQLDRARSLLTGKEPLDIHSLGAYPQTGFRVAAQLAARYGFRVDLDAPNLFGGTRALVFVPTALLTDVPREQPSLPAARSAYDARNGYGHRSGHGGLREHGGYGSQVGQVGQASQMGQMGTAAGYGAPGADHTGPHDPAQAPATTASGLTRRRRRAPGPAPVAEPVEREVRPGRPDIAAAWVSGSRRGRSSDSQSASSKDGS
ncbi:ATP-binding protein [Actinacidiphila yeochonensis]|uniref:hypothetical protein n=1 Tax=Actinacidiphila yeochonensis TaxID=89050 RepID=UPI001E5073AC|nr:hypothetical protein [Actinacidiphila yeochonensis]